MSRENDPQVWLEFARRDLIHCAPLCEQAVEKALKAVIVAQTRGLPPKSHNLRKLLKVVGNIPDWVSEKMPDIEAHYFIARYPADVDLDFYNEANTHALLEDTEEIYQWLSVRVSELTRSSAS